MRPALVSYFDLGQSFGLGDSAFLSDALASELDLSLIGWTNPLGRGVALNLLTEGVPVVELWRESARAQVRRPSFESGWVEESGVGSDTFLHALEESVATHNIRVCALRIYALGTVLTCLEFDAGLPDEHVEGVLRSFEFAAYTVPVSEALQQAALERAVRVARAGSNRMRAMSQRNPPGVFRDAAGYAESRLFSSFTNLLLCVDDGDRNNVPALARRWGLAESDLLPFEYHGKLHYGWATCLLEPREAAEDRTESPKVHESPDEQILRMVACIELAHVFLGACEAMTSLFLGEIQDQAGSYVSAVHGRGATDLNRLRILALATNSLTNFRLVTPTSEDQGYFERFDLDANIGQYRQLITEAGDVLYNVQAAEQESVVAQRQYNLNAAVLVLTCLSLVTVVIAGYDFVRARQEIIRTQVQRIDLLFLLVSIIAALAGILLVRSRPRDGGARQSRSSRQH